MAIPHCMSANISMMFCEHEPLDRIAAAADAGFKAVEVQYPYQQPASLWRRRAIAAGIEIVLINAPAGDRSRGERGFACVPGREAEFRASTLAALDYAEEIGCLRVHVLTGVLPTENARPMFLASGAASLAWAAEAAGKRKMTLLLEALNQTDAPGYFLRSEDDSAALIDAAGAPAHSLGILFDVYHCAMGGRDVAAQFARHFPRIGHIQVADVPGRAQPGTGTLDWLAIFAMFATHFYRGFIGCEYNPLGPTASSLGWMEGPDLCGKDGG